MRFLIVLGITLIVLAPWAFTGWGSNSKQTTLTAPCPEDSQLIGGGGYQQVGTVCIASDNFGVCRVMQTWARRVNNATAYRARNKACAWQRNKMGGLLR